MVDVIHPTGRVQHAIVITHIANVELELGISVTLTHVVLLLLVTAENANFSDVCVQEAVENGIAEGTGAAGDEESFI
ncbi:hypothetical protein GCM10009104_18410 [Marinobacterium maritimum]|uniref:Uncharacterized protein n=1 Tax=Marinobacterium maritimum TaxID=500162 RepID=A0ABN1I678_9GAMM